MYRFVQRHRSQCLLVTALLLTALVLVLAAAGDEGGELPAAQEGPLSAAGNGSGSRPIERDSGPALGPVLTPGPSASRPAPAAGGPSVSGTLLHHIFLPLAEGGPHRIVLIIDDLGHNFASGNRAIELSADITFAVLPHTPHGRTLAETAHRSGREVMLHAPMSNDAKMPLGPGGLTTELSEEEFDATLLAAFEDIPHVRGLNNHMGSELTRKAEPMARVMRVLRERGLYFVDSVTTADSIAAEVAGEYRVPNTRRQVFLDHSTEPVDIHFQFLRLLDIARREGQAVAIGHPYPETLDYLEKVIPRLAAKGYELIPVSALLSGPQREEP